MPNPLISTNDQVCKIPICLKLQILKHISEREGLIPYDEIKTGKECRTKSPTNFPHPNLFTNLCTNYPLLKSNLLPNKPLPSPPHPNAKPLPIKLPLDKLPQRRRAMYPRQTLNLPHFQLLRLRLPTPSLLNLTIHRNW